jgi:hypothetical protein
VATKIHAVAAIIDCLGYSADLFIGLKNDGLDLGATQQLERSCQSRGPGPGNYRDLSLIIHVGDPCMAAS